MWLGFIFAGFSGLAGIAGIATLFVFPPIGIMLVVGSFFGLLTSMGLVRPAQQAIDQARAAKRRVRFERYFAPRDPE